MRIFNTSGPCNPDLHYTVMREDLVATGQQLVEQGRYFTIFAPRQAGKTTYFQLLFRHLQHQNFTPVWISFESLRTIGREKFYQVMGHELQRALASYGLKLNYSFADQVDVQHFFEALRAETPRIVLVIDEFEDVPAAVMSELLHAFRKMYHQKEYYALHSLALVGVGSLAELVVSSASPFNIVDELQIPYFSRGEVEHLIGEYVSDSGQRFAPEVLQAIYDNTQGQPGLVCALCHYLVTAAVPNRAEPVTQDAFYATLRHFLTERLDKNILNVVQKAKEKQAFMLRLLFDDNPIPFTVDDENIAYLHANGVVDNVDGFVEIPVPLYSKRLITAFRPLIQGETRL
ncbi:MAG: AAA-like domain-containing protein [Chloroflexi bacterium]|nr:AAA-like domain-containing protein [Chloroflexota bacterium]